MLYGVEIPSSGGGTSIADMRAAYWSLEEEERRELEGLRTVNSLDPERTDTRPEDLARYGAPVVHPMVRTHPVSRERAIYFHPTKTAYIEGMTPEASKEYLSGLVERIIKPDIVYQHSWVKGDVLVIDDRATLHRAHDDYDHNESRVLWRIIVEGDRPTLV
jgi:taurine dioxygenase